MMTQVLHCPYCQGTARVRHGMTPEGKQRDRYRVGPGRGRTFLLDYAYAGQSPDVKQQRLLLDSRVLCFNVVRQSQLIP
jgi:transposase-like protein